jgi:hypothetical protein
MVTTLKTKQETDKKPLRYWFVEFTSKDGKLETFYVKAKDHFQAYKIGEEWGQILEENPELGGFKMRY